MALPFILLLAVEGGLRLAGVGASHPLFIEADSDGRWLHMNPRVSERYFYGDFTAPGATNDPFRALKTPGSYRIVVQGASTTLGFPFFYGAAFPRMLEWRLQETFPDREIEVVNTALTAVNSHTLLDFADEIVEQDPDAVLIYAGHNEYYGAFGVASTRAGANTRWVSLYLRLRRLRLVQVLASALESVSGGAEPAGQTRGTMMERMVGEQVIPLGSELYQGGLAQFERNMDALLGRYERAGIPVYIATLVSNERNRPPFISQPDPSVPSGDWEAALASARERLADGDRDGASAALGGLADRDRTNAAAFFRAATLLDSAAAHPEARRFYLAAKDRDLLRFRAPEAINGMVRELAREHGAVLVDVQEIFAEASPDSIVGETLVTEHVHPTVDGYFLLAEAFYEALRQGGAIGSWEGALPRDEARRRVPVTAVDSLYGVFLLRSLTAGWPFQEDPEEERRLLEELRSHQPADPVEAIALALFRRQVPWTDAMLELFGHFQRLGLSEEAGRVARALAQEMPLSGTPYELLARVAMSTDSLARAEAWLQRGWSMEPTLGIAMLSGAVYLRQGRREEALAAFERGVRLAPNAPGPRTVLGAARALPQLEQRVSEAPGDADALYELATAYAMTNLTAQARATVERLMEVEPESPRAMEILSMIGPPAPSSRPPSGLP